MKQHKRQLHLFSFYDHTGITANLERMAQEGWLLEKAGNFFLRYRAIQPQRIRYCVVYSSEASEFDSSPNEEVQCLDDLCAQAGWIKTASLGQMQIYRSEDPNAIPIETDARLQAQTVHQAMKKNFIPGQVAMLVLSFLQFLLAWLRYDLNPLDFVSNGSNFLGLGCYVLIAIMCCAELAGYFRWRRQVLKTGDFCPTRGNRRLQQVCLVLVLVWAALWLLTIPDPRMGLLGLYCMALALGVLLIALGIKNLMKKLHASRAAAMFAYWLSALVLCVVMVYCMIASGMSIMNSGWLEGDVETYHWQGMSWEAHKDPLPLYAEDLTATDYDLYSTQRWERISPLVWTVECAQTERVGDSGNPELSYTIYRTSFPGLIQHLVERDLTVREYWDPRQLKETSLTVPGGQVLRLWELDTPHNTWLIRLPDRIILLYPSWELTQAQLDTAMAKLAGK